MEIFGTFPFSYDAILLKRTVQAQRRYHGLPTIQCFQLDILYRLSYEQVFSTERYLYRNQMSLQSCIQVSFIINDPYDHLFKISKLEAMHLGKATVSSLVQTFAKQNIYTGVDIHDTSRNELLSLKFQWDILYRWCGSLVMKHT